MKRLTTRSDARIKNDQDFAYILEDIKTLKERLLDKSLSLNETTRLKEKDDEKEKRETRKKERKDRDPCVPFCGFPVFPFRRPFPSGGWSR